MYIERIQVEEGFLSGLDITLTPRLNVIIGARGTGKTSLIELIRFCLDAVGNTADVVRRSREHALSILGSGQVTLTLVSNGQRIIVSRTASDIAPRASGIYMKPIVFSQTEIETVGLEAPGRLRLIDSFISSIIGESAEEKQVVADVASLTAESTKIRQEIEELERQLKEAPVIAKELTEIAEMEANVAKSSNVLQQKTTQLQVLSEQLSTLAVSEATHARIKDEISAWYHSIKSASEFPVSDEPVSQGVLRAFVQQISTARAQLRQALQITHEVWSSLDNESKTISAKRLTTEASARGFRQRNVSMTLRHQVGLFSV